MFKVGDLVVRKESFLKSGSWEEGRKPVKIIKIENGLWFEGVDPPSFTMRVTEGWNKNRFELFKRKSKSHLPKWW